MTEGEEGGSNWGNRLSSGTEFEKYEGWGKDKKYIPRKREITRRKKTKN